MRHDSLTGPDSDPWANPVTTQTLNPSAASHTIIVNGTRHGDSATANGFVPRNTSPFTTHSDSPSNVNEASRNTSANAGRGGASWNSYNSDSAAGFSEQPTLGGGFGEAGDHQEDQDPESSRPVRGPSGTGVQGAGEVVTITMLPEKEGMFMFQHRNYEVKSARRGSSVVRRYSDFVWLLDCLHKRYPFRRLPLLPPKRVAGMLPP